MTTDSRKTSAPPRSREDLLLDRLEKGQRVARRILVADDNADSAGSMAMILRILGHEACTAHDGLEVVQMATAFRPDVILLDIGMPEIDGYEVCRRIRREPWGEAISIIALTGWGTDEDRKRSREAGFDHHLVKPVDPAEVEKLLAVGRA